MDLSNVTFTIKKGGYFVSVDRGYLGYGISGGDSCVERLSHFLAWSDVPSISWLRSWCRHFLDGLPEVFGSEFIGGVHSGCPSVDQGRLSPACVVNPGGYCSACGAGRDHS